MYNVMDTEVSSSEEKKTETNVVSRGKRFRSNITTFVRVIGMHLQRARFCGRPSVQGRDGRTSGKGLLWFFYTREDLVSVCAVNYVSIVVVLTAAPCKSAVVIKIILLQRQRACRDRKNRKK